MTNVPPYLKPLDVDARRMLRRELRPPPGVGDKVALLQYAHSAHKTILALLATVDHLDGIRHDQWCAVHYERACTCPASS